MHFYNKIIYTTYIITLYFYNKFIYTELLQ